MTTDRSARARTAAFRALIAAAAVSGVWLASAQLPERSVSRNDEGFVPEPRVAQLMAFGFDAVMADFYWMRAVQIVGSNEGPAGHSRVLASLIDVVTTLDPHVSHPYRFAAVWIHDDVPSVRRANELLRRGIANHPEDWRGHFYLAFNHFFYLDEQAEAATALEGALDLPGRPAYLSRLAARLRSESGGLDASAAFLDEMRRQAKSDDEREQYAVALREVETERRARFLDAARAEYVRRHGRDIAAVEDLVEPGLLNQLPRDPFGEGWELSAENGEIVSKHVRYRYGVKIDATNRQLIEQFRERSRAIKSE